MQPDGPLLGSMGNLSGLLSDLKADVAFAATQQPMRTPSIAAAATAAPASSSGAGVTRSPWGGKRKSGAAAVAVSVAMEENSCHRNYMEDTHRVIDPLSHEGGRSSEVTWGLFAVYDGHGGRQEADYCQSRMHEILLGELRDQGGGRSVEDALVASFKKVDGQLAMLGAWSSGCTATVALAHRNASGALTLYVANVGDSRAILVNGSTVRRVSYDHRASDPREKERIVKDGGQVSKERVGGSLSVSRSLGDHMLKDRGVSCVPDVSCSEVGIGEALVIASDGLWDVIDDAEAGRILSGCVEAAETEVGKPEAVAEILQTQAAQVLVERAKELDARDNIMVVVVFF